MRWSLIVLNATDADIAKFEKEQQQIAPRLIPSGEYVLPLEVINTPKLDDAIKRLLQGAEKREFTEKDFEDPKKKQ